MRTHWPRVLLSKTVKAQSIRPSVLSDVEIASTVIGTWMMLRRISSAWHLMPWLGRDQHRWGHQNIARDG